MKRLYIILAIALLTVSCTDAGRSKLGGYGGEFTIELVNCDGSVTREWVSSGKVLSTESSDGYFFNEKGTNRLIEVSGTLIITRIK